MTIEKSKNDNCVLLLRGMIAPGDLEKLKILVEFERLS